MFCPLLTAILTGGFNFHSSIRLTTCTRVQCMPSVLWRCWLGDRKGIRPVKNWVLAGVVICLQWDADLHMAQLMPLPLTVSCFSKIQIGYTFLVPANPNSPGNRAVKCVCVCVCVWIRVQCMGKHTYKWTSVASLNANPPLLLCKVQ